jgi:predicted GNAT superfamily acetyltransferase
MKPARRIDIQPLHTQEQFRDAVRLQREIWQFEDVELLPVRLFVVATKIGGQAFGAYHDKRMVGFALALPGIKPGYGAYLHSHMVGVAEGYRNDGIGRMLKLRQREDAIARGLDLMEWTFDPLELKNAYFNIERLGAIVRRYVRNQYGTTTSVLHGGLPTDRCVAEWWFRKDRVVNAIAGGPIERPEVERRIAVPSDVARLRAEDMASARSIQARVSDQFMDAFDRGLAVIGFERGDAVSNYLLGKWQ